MNAALTGYVVDTSSTPDLRAQIELTTPAGESGTLTVAIVHLSTLAAFDLTACQVAFAVKYSTGQVFISKQATSANPSSGVAVFTLLIADTSGMRGDYTYDVWLKDSLGARYQVVLASPFRVLTAVGQPGQLVIVTPDQEPLALGPPGPAPTGSAGQFLRLVSSGIAEAVTLTQDLVAPTDRLRIASGTAGRLKFYCRTTGSDSNNGLSSGAAFRTPQHAIDTAVAAIGRGFRTVIDCAGSFDFTASGSLVIPAALNGQDQNYVFTNTDWAPFSHESFITLQAIPTVLVTLNPGTTTTVADANTGMRTFTDSSQAWTVNQWKGKFLYGSGGGQVAVIQSNTATQLVTTAPLAYSSPKICDVGATFTYNNASFLPVITARGTRVTLNGFELATTVTTGCFNGDSLDAMGSRFNEGFSIGEKGGFANDTHIGCHYIGRGDTHADFIFGTGASIQRGYFNSCNPSFGAWGLLTFAQFDNGSLFNDDFALQNVAISNSHFIGTGITVGEGCVIQASHLTIDNSSLSGITIRGNGILRCDDHGNLQGTGNARYGIEMIGRSLLFLKPTDSNTVTGTLGDVKVGYLAPRTWVDLAANHPIGIQHDVLGDGSCLRLVDAGWPFAGGSTSSGLAYPDPVFPGAMATKTFAQVIVAVNGSTGSDADNNFYGNQARPAVLTGGDYSASPFATLAAARAALPGHLAHDIILRIAAGTYAGAVFDGFTGHGRLRITAAGAYTLATLASGPNSGTAAGGTSSTTLNNPGSNWTASDLRGRLLVVDSGGGSSGDSDNPTVRRIKSNTTTQATVDAVTGLDSTSVFRIVAAGVTVNQAAAPLVAGSVQCLGFADCTAPVELVGVHPTDAALINGVYATRCRQITAWGLLLDTNATATFYATDCGEASVYDSWVKSTASVAIQQGRVARAERIVSDNGTIAITDCAKQRAIVDAASCSGNALTMKDALNAYAVLKASSCTATPFVGEALLNFTNGGLSGANAGATYCADLSHGGNYYLGGATMTCASANDASGTPQTDWFLLDGYGARLGEVTTAGAVDGVGARAIASTGRLLMKSKLQLAINASSLGDEFITNDGVFGGQTKNYGFDYAQSPAYQEITAHVGGGQGSATQIAYRRTVIATCASDNDSVILPLTAAGGAGGTIYNSTAHSANLFPPSGTHINALGSDTAIAIAAGSWAEWISLNSGNYAVKVF